jgi:hypothetical protein
VNDGTRWQPDAVCVFDVDAGPDDASNTRHCAKGYLLEGRSAVCQVAPWHKADNYLHGFIHISVDE